MKDRKEKRCPGCSERCPASAPCCKFGKRYFAKQEAKFLHSKVRKWEKNIRARGTAWLLVTTGRGVKSVLRKSEMTEEQIFARVSPEEMNQLCDILERVRRTVSK